MTPQSTASPRRLPRRVRAALSSVRALLALATLVVPVLTGACGPRHPPAAAAPAASGTPHRGGTLVTGWTAEPSSVNELIAPPTNPELELLILIFDHLVEEQGDFQKGPPTFAPLLARSYDWSPDHKILTFHLREDAVWSDGVPLTADDVRFTWQAEVDPAVAWQYAYMAADISDVEAADPHTVRFHFKRVYAKQMLDANEVGIMPRHVWGQIPFARWRQSGDWFKQHAVGCGPFVVESWTPQQEIVLRRNERYYDPHRPYLDRVVMRVLPSYANIMTQLDSGNIEYTPVVNPGDAKRIAANPRLRLLPFWYRTVVSVMWNGSRQPFVDPEVRRALALALDRQAIVDTIWKGYARLSDSPVMTAVWAHDPALRPLPHDPAEARRILAAKGWKPGPDGILQRDGKPFKFELLTNAGNQQRLEATTMIQAQLRTIGVQVEPRQIEFNSMTELLDAGTFEAAMDGMNMDTGLDLSPRLHSKAIGGTNDAHYSNPRVDHLIDHSMSLPDIAQARADLYAVQEIVQQEQPYTFLWESQRISAYSRRLHGVRPSLLFSFYNLKDWWLEPGNGNS